MKKGTAHENAKAIIGLLIVAIGFVLFYKLYINQEFFLDDPEALQDYVILSVVGMGFLLGLFFLVSKSVHHAIRAPKAKAVKSVPAKKSAKKKTSK
mgnify:CR=1 FL=1